MIQRIIRPVVGVIRSVVYRLKDFLESSEISRSVLQDTNNRLQFSNLLLHEQMIADKVRLDFYDAGIKRYIMPGDTVVDLGTGTGILSFLAAQ